VEGENEAVISVSFVISSPNSNMIAEPRHKSGVASELDMQEAA
jgi:hypothetical protein